MTLPSLNFGGGFGVPCFRHDQEFDLRTAGALLQESLAGEDRLASVELGRYLTAPAGIYLTRVLYTKRSNGRRFAILDGGMHHHAAAAGVGAVIRRPYPIVSATSPLTLATDRGVTPQTLCGPLCIPTDEFGEDLALPRLEPDDLVAVLVSGAYGLSFSGVLFLSHPTPSEILVDGGRAYLARQPGRPADALRGQFLPGEA